jgi:hypothetical protein
MKQKNNFINDLLKFTSKDYIFDLYESRYIIPSGVKSAEYYINNTLDLYFEYHKTLNPNFFNKVKDLFIEIVKNDKIIELDNKIILKELYKILFLIDNTNQLLDFISQPSYPKKYFASYQSDKREINREKKRHKNMIVKAKTPIVHKGEHRLNWWFNDMFAKNQKVVKFYLHIFTLIDLERCNFIKKESKELQLKVINFLESKLIQRTGENDILKSLSILLHSELKYFLKIKDTKAKEQVTQIILNLLNYKPNDEEFNKTIYFRSSIKFMPIFGAKKDSHYDINEKFFIKTNILKELSTKEQKDFDNNEFDKLFELMLKKPHIQFLNKYPVELFRKNPKYSTLND